VQQVDLNPEFDRCVFVFVDSSSVEEVFNWLLEVEESSEPWEGGRIVWGIRYVLEGDTRFHGHTTPAHGSSHFALQQRRARLLKEGGATHDDDERRKLTARFDTQKDDIHAVLPISKVGNLIFYTLCYVLGSGGGRETLIFTLFVGHDLRNRFYTAAAFNSSLPANLNAFQLQLKVGQRM